MNSNNLLFSIGVNIIDPVHPDGWGLFNTFISVLLVFCFVYILVAALSNFMVAKHRHDYYVYKYVLFMLPIINNTKSQNHKTNTRSKKFNLFVFSTVSVISSAGFSILQELVFTFLNWKYPIFVTTLVCASTTIVAYVVKHYHEIQMKNERNTINFKKSRHIQEPIYDTSPTRDEETRVFLMLAGMAFMGTLCSALALQHVTYTTRIAFKSFKLLPVFLLSNFTGLRVDRKWPETFVCIGICFGVLIFSYGDVRQEGVNIQSHLSHLTGLFLLTLAIVSEGCISIYIKKTFFHRANKPIEDIEENGLPRNSVTSVFSSEDSIVFHDNYTIGEVNHGPASLTKETISDDNAIIERNGKFPKVPQRSHTLHESLGHSSPDSNKKRSYPFIIYNTGKVATILCVSLLLFQSIYYRFTTYMSNGYIFHIEDPLTTPLIICLKYPGIFLVVTLMSFFAFASVVFSLTIVDIFDPVTSEGVKSVRKVVAICLSFLIFPKAFSWFYIVGGIILGCSSYYGFILKTEVARNSDGDFVKHYQ